MNADNQIDFWKELTAELAFMLTTSGKTSLAINKTAGIIQVTDRPSALKRVEDYLKGVDTSIHRQVEIEAKLYDVTLNNQFQFGIDWVHMAKAYGGAIGFGGATLPAAVGSGQLLDSAVGGLNRNYGRPDRARREPVRHGVHEFQYQGGDHRAGTAGQRGGHLQAQPAHAQ